MIATIMLIHAYVLLLLLISNMAYWSCGLGLEGNNPMRFLGYYSEIEIGSNAIVKQGSTVTINCRIEDISNTTDYEWKLNSSIIIFGNSSFRADQPYFQISKNRIGEIVIYNITEDLTGQYTCISRTQAGAEVIRKSLLQINKICPLQCVGENGSEGIKGKRGEEGLRGVSGNQGTCYNEQCQIVNPELKGEIGSPGIKGVIGGKGEQGQNGTKGTKGILGEKGLKGNKGENGDIGEVGLSGMKGKKGDKGEQGIRGNRGIKGLKGIMGLNGTKGDKGEIGMAVKGTMGRKGVNGSEGEIGNRGRKGMNGDNGPVGEKGELGKTGVTGDKGVIGSKGNRGIEIIKMNISSNINSSCKGNFEVGQIVYDTAIGEFIYCNGHSFICILHRSCFPSEIPPELSFEVRETVTNVVKGTVYQMGPVLERDGIYSISLFSIEFADTYFALKSSLVNGSSPINVEWYYKENDNSSNRTVLIGRPNGITKFKNFILTRTSWSEGFYYLNVSNEFGYDYQVAKVGIIPKWIEDIDCINGCFGKNLVAVENSEVMLSSIVFKYAKFYKIQYSHNDMLVAEYSSLPNSDFNVKIKDFNFNLTVNQGEISLVILKYNSSYSGNYTARVENEFGLDTITTIISTELVVNCYSDSNTTTNQEHCVCTNDLDNNQLVYEIYGHSFAIGSQLQWIVTDSEGNKIESLSKTVRISRKMIFNLPYEKFCNNSVSAVAEQGNMEQIINFSCNCNVDCGNNKCCEKFDDLISKNCGNGKNFTSIYVLIDTSSSMVGKHEFLKEFLPQLEKGLTDNCIGTNGDRNKRNHYITIGFSGAGDKNAFFIGPDFDSDFESQQSLPFLIDPECESGVETSCSNVNSLVERLKISSSQKADGYAATKFAKVYYDEKRNGEQPTNLIFLISNGKREFEGSYEELLMRSIYDRNDDGNSKYIGYLRDIFQSIPVNLVNAALKAEPNSQEVECIGVTGLHKCLYLSNDLSQNNTILETYENVYIDTKDPESEVKENIRINYVQTALEAGGIVINLNEIISQPNSRQALIQALITEVFSNTFVERLATRGCQQCTCVFGNMTINCNLLDELSQDRCVCLQTSNNNENYCNCIMSGNDAQKCHCLYIANQTASACVSGKGLIVRN